MIKRIGYIGLGLMGKPIASNLLKAGFELTVHNRSQEAVEELVALGALEADSPCQVAEESEVIITNLPDSQDVEEVVLGGGGVLEGASEGARSTSGKRSVGTRCTRFRRGYGSQSWHPRDHGWRTQRSI
jgi:3-hydroxyisobutyrate dehydrogenase-like beta-hydroxyacid dehydrogenase